MQTGIHRALAHAGGVQSTLAAVAQVTPQVIAYWLKIGGIPKLGPALRISRAYDIPIEHLAPREEVSAA